MKRIAYFGATLTALCLSQFTAAPAAAAIDPTADPILYWNDVALANIGALAAAAPQQTRSLAMFNVAMYDAVNAALGSPGTAYLTGVSNMGGDVRAAAAVAAHDVLVSLSTSSAATANFDAALVSSLAQIADSAAKDNGKATGAAYAAAAIANRTGDGSAPHGSYVPGTDPGKWRPTPPNNPNPVTPWWGDVDPWTMTSGDQFRAAPPPALDSAEYAAAYNEVMLIGASNSATRTAEQTKSALFWAPANGATWLRIGVDLAADEGLDTFGYARTFGLLTTTLADAIIAGFDTKYEYNFWRPVTAIREGNADGNALTIGDPTWSALFNTPGHPSYISTHSDLSAAASTILTTMIGDDESFCSTIGANTRCWNNMAEASQDAADSRLWGGIHFRFDNEAGLAMGRSVANYALSNSVFAGVPEPASWAMMISGFGLIGGAMRRRNMAPMPLAI